MPGPALPAARRNKHSKSSRKRRSSHSFSTASAAGSASGTRARPPPPRRRRRGVPETLRAALPGLCQSSRHFERSSSCSPTTAAASAPPPAAFRSARSGDESSSFRWQATTRPGPWPRASANKRSWSGWCCICNSTPWAGGLSCAPRSVFDFQLVGGRLPLGVGPASRRSYISFLVFGNLEIAVETQRPSCLLL